MGQLRGQVFLILLISNFVTLRSLPATRWGNSVHPVGTMVGGGNAYWQAMQWFWKACLVLQLSDSQGFY